jgi:hypothetical protein
LRRAAGRISLDEAVEDEEEVDPSSAGLEKHGAARQPLHNAEAGDALDLISSQTREGLCLAHTWIRGSKTSSAKNVLASDFPLTLSAYARHLPAYQRHIAWSRP